MARDCPLLPLVGGDGPVSGVPRQASRIRKQLLRPDETSVTGLVWLGLDNRLCRC